MSIEKIKEFTLEYIDRYSPHNIEELDKLIADSIIVLKDADTTEWLKAMLVLLTKHKSLWESFDKARKDFEKEHIKPVQQLIKTQLDKIEDFAEKVKNKFLEMRKDNDNVSGVFKYSPKQINQIIDYSQINYGKYPDLFDMVPVINQDKVMKWLETNETPNEWKKTVEIKESCAIQWKQLEKESK